MRVYAWMCEGVSVAVCVSMPVYRCVCVWESVCLLESGESDSCVFACECGVCVCYFVSVLAYLYEHV